MMPHNSTLSVMVFACQHLGKDLHTTMQMKGAMKSQLLDVVVQRGTSIFELLASKDQVLLIGGWKVNTLGISL